MDPLLLTSDELESESNEKLLVHEWRTEQLWRLGIPRAVAEAFADLVDWHALAELIEHGCSPVLALEIVR